MGDNDVKKVTIYFRNGYLIISETTKGNDIATIAQRMSAGGYMVCEDALWGETRQVAVNLSDVSVVILTSCN